MGPGDARLRAAAARAGGNPPPGQGPDFDEWLRIWQERHAPRNRRGGGPESGQGIGLLIAHRACCSGCRRAFIS